MYVLRNEEFIINIIKKIIYFDTSVMISIGVTSLQNVVTSNYSCFRQNKILDRRDVLVLLKPV